MLDLFLIYFNNNNNNYPKRGGISPLFKAKLTENAHQQSTLDFWLKLFVVGVKLFQNHWYKFAPILYIYFF